MKTIIITECYSPYGKYWIFRNKENGQKVAEIDKKKASDFGWDGYVIYGGPGWFTEIGRRSNKNSAFEFAKEHVRNLYLGDVEFKWNVMSYRQGYR